MWLNKNVAIINAMLKILDITSLIYIYIYIYIDGPTWTDWTEQKQCGLNRTKVDRMDRMEPKWTKQTEQD